MPAEKPVKPGAENNTSGEQDVRTTVDQNELEHTIRRLQKENEQLTGENKNLQKELKECRSSGRENEATYKRETALLNRKILDLEKKLEEAGNDSLVKDLNGQIRRLNTEKKVLTQKLETSETARKESEKAEIELKRRVVELTKSNNDLNNLLGKCEATRKENENQANDLKEKLDKMAVSHEDLKNGLDRCRAAGKESENHANALEQQVTQLVKDNSNLRNDLGQCKAAHKESEKQAKDYEHQVDQITVENKNLKFELEKCAAAKKESEKSNIDLKRRVKKLTDENVALAKQAKDCQDARRECDLLIIELKNRIKTLTVEVENLKRQLQECLENKNDQIILELNHQIRRLTTDNEELKRELDGCRFNLEKCGEKVKDLEHIKDQLEESISDLEKRLKDCEEEEGKKWEQLVQNLKDDIAQLTSENLELKKQIESSLNGRARSPEDFAAAIGQSLNTLQTNMSQMSNSISNFAVRELKLDAKVNIDVTPLGMVEYRFARPGDTFDADKLSDLSLSIVPLPKDASQGGYNNTDFDLTVGLEEIKGIDDSLAERFYQNQVYSIGDLLMVGTRIRTRITLASMLEVDRRRLDDWIDHAKLIAVRGIDGDIAMILFELGIKDMSILAEQSPETLSSRFNTFLEEAGSEVETVTPEQVDDWIKAARAFTCT